MIDGVWTRVGTGSGFLVDGYIVTCGHNLDFNEDSELFAIFPELIKQADTGAFQYAKPREAVRGYSPENSYDFAILEAVLESPGLGLSFSDREPTAGEPVCSMGFAFDGNSLNIHQGIVSNVAKSGVATMLTLDMSVNPGNSGGPLISMIDGKVLGVVVRKATGLTAAFDQLLGVMEDNIKGLEQNPNRGRVFTSGFDMAATFGAIQTQLYSVSQQMKRSAMVGIGYAVYIDPLRDEEAFSRQ